MKFRCEKDSLATALGQAGRAVAKTVTGSFIHQGLMLHLKSNELTVTGSDIDLTIQVKLEVAGSDEGEVFLPVRPFVDIVRSLPPGSVSVSLGEQILVVTDSEVSSEFQVRTSSLTDQVSVPQVEGETITVLASEFAAGLRRVVPAARKDDSRPILTGVLVATKDSGLRLVATDSFRLGLNNLAGMKMAVDETGVIIPSRALEEITRLIGEEKSLEVKLDDNNAIFQVANVTVITRLINGDFPSYEGLIPKDHPNQLTVERTEMLEAIKRVRLVGNDDTPIRVKMEQNLLTLSSGADAGEARVIIKAIDYVGEELEIAFNAKYLSDGVEAADSERICLSTADPLKPAILKKAEDSDFLYLLMPVRVT